MDKISEIFKNKKCLITYLTAGDPDLDKTAEYIVTMSKSGADLIEIGIPFSDPTAEGEVIQNAMMRALKNDITIDKIFDAAAKAGKEIQTPLVFMTYLNPVFSYGYDKFFKKCKETGISGVIVPDMPFEEQDEIRQWTSKYGVDIITLIAPTSQERIEKLAAQAEGFIYLVSSLGVTGIRTKITTDIEKIVSQIKKTASVPVAVGFGISTPAQVKEMTKYADGAIVGSAIVKIIAEYGQNASKPLAEYVSSLKQAASENSAAF
ncbi:MAG: tryptophan synthase subunit alpha [Endomicrobium sp.]|jgi:tryptophan synthase alpha chain|nr:tryptophan synthase subunit alpha [Endomicrobium sp.]